MFINRHHSPQTTTPGGRSVGFVPNLWDVLAFALLLGALVLAAHGARETLVPLSSIETGDLSLDPVHLPEYALRTTLRMLAAIAASLVFTFLYATLAAKNRHAELVLIPLLDILQSVPVLGFLSFTVLGFMALFPGRVLGLEAAAVFAIFTSQAWNMAFSFYQSLRSVPKDLDEACRSFRLSGWQRFWRLEVPFAMPGLIWNTMMSMSGGWFFVVASEVITVGDGQVSLPGIGSYVALAIARQDLPAVGWAVFTMLAVIIAYDQLLFRPLVAWGGKFRVELTASQTGGQSWVLILARRTRLLMAAVTPLARLSRAATRLRLGAAPAARRRGAVSSPWLDRAWLGLVLAVTSYAVWRIGIFIAAELSWGDLAQAMGLGCLTLIRVMVLIVLASLIWVPVGVWIGLRPRLAEKAQPVIQFLAAFPANLVFPVVVVAIVRFDLSPDIWLSPLMVLGTQWYILFNVIAGASSFPADLKEASSGFRIRGWLWWRKVILPGIFPYYLTGCITASGGSWNASIVAEIANWGGTQLTAHGLGAYIAQASDRADYPRIVLGIAVMSLFVIVLNRLLWRPLQTLAANRLRLD